MNTTPTVTPSAPPHQAAHPLNAAGPARRRWVSAHLAQIVVAAVFAPLLWLIASTASLLPAFAAAAAGVGLVVVSRWLRWAAWAHVPGAHSRGSVRQHEPGLAVLFTLARIVALAGGGLLLAAQLSTPGQTSLLAGIGGLLAGVGVVLALHDLIRRRLVGPRAVALALAEAAAPLVWVVGTGALGWAGLGLALSGAITTIVLLSQALIQGLTRWSDRRDLARGLD